MQTFDSLFTRKLAELILERIDSAHDQLEHQLPTDMLAMNIRYIQGQIAALREMPTLIEEASRLVSQDKR